MDIDRETKKAILDLSELEKAIVVYDVVTNTLHIMISEEEADETILLENNIIVKLSQGKIVSISIQDILKSS